MTIKNGIKFGIGFAIGEALVGFAARVLLDCMKKHIENLKESEQTENKDVEVE